MKKPGLVALPEKSGNTLSLCNLYVLCVSVVRYFLVEITTETQRTQRLHREEASSQTFRAKPVRELESKDASSLYG